MATCADKGDGELDAGASLSHRRNRGACIVNSNDQSNQTDNLLKQVDALQRQIDSLESRCDGYSATLSALWTILKRSEGGAALVLQIQKDAHAILQTMKLEEIYALS